jgi:ferredoxin
MSPGMKVSVDGGLCQGYGNCAMSAPEVFVLDEATGLATVVKPEPAPEQHAAVEEAVRLCPVRAIRAAEESG